MDFFILDLLNLCYTNLFLPKDYETNDKTILKYFQEVLKKLKWKKSIVWFVVIIKNPKISYIFKKYWRNKAKWIYK